MYIIHTSMYAFENFFQTTLASLPYSTLQMATMSLSRGCSASANNAGQLLLSIVGRTGEVTAVWLNVMQVAWSSRSSSSGLSIFVHAFVWKSTLITVVCSHEISAVFDGPVSGTLGVSWDHEYTLSNSSMAHSAGHVIAVKMS